ncbi:hypothetical protein TeGR_g5499 [Tetraparma gracilis]|nr:hypothetical protein TeGR_g5499 [Tetraparma gracilis]
MYTCGPTIYAPAHLGNFRAFLTYDVLKRTLAKVYGRRVDHVCNLTDVDDKIIRRCRETGRSLRELTDPFEEQFRRDLDGLNVVPAKEYPRATDYIPEIVELIGELEGNGLAYERGDGWYYNTTAKEGYGTNLVDLSSRELPPSPPGTPPPDRDFALWKREKEGVDVPSALWDSPLGRGRPGWHVECSAICRSLLGDRIDLHMGGEDLKFPHHENEIAQSEGVRGREDRSGSEPFCGCWVHNGFVNIGGAGEKMSKSLGNDLTLSAECPGPLDKRAFRYLVVSSHYRSPLSYTPLAMDAARAALRRLDKLLAALDALPPPPDGGAAGPLSELCAASRASFEAALAQDLATPRAAAVMFGVVKAAEKELREGGGDLAGLREARRTLGYFDEVFGVFYLPPGEVEEQAGGEAPAHVAALAEARAEAKKGKDFGEADRLRGEIEAAGWAVADTPGGSFELSEL